MTGRWKWRTGPHVHDWFPGLPQSEFLGHADTCLECKAARFTPPWGECLGGHPLADHYTADGERVEVPACRAGGPL